MDARRRSVGSWWRVACFAAGVAAALGGPPGALAGDFWSDAKKTTSKIGGQVSGGLQHAANQASDVVQHAGGQVSHEAQHAGGQVSDAVKHAADQVSHEAAKLDPSDALRREFAREQAEALRGLRRLDPNTVFDSVQRSIESAVNAELARQGARADFHSGEVDLRGTVIGRTLAKWLAGFAQGNKRASEVEELGYNAKSRRLSVRLYVRHSQSWGKVIPGQRPMDLYSVSQRASFWYDFGHGSGDFVIDLGPLAPRITAKTARALSDVDLVSAAQSMAPGIGGQLLNHEEDDEYALKLRRYTERYGAGNVYFASKSFVNWATPETLGRYAVNGVVTLGASVAPQVMADLRARAMTEEPAIASWLSSKGMENVQEVATELLTGRTPRWPFLKFEMFPVRYRSREHPLHATTTPWRDVDHAAFAIVWIDSGDHRQQPAHLAGFEPAQPIAHIIPGGHAGPDSHFLPGSHIAQGHQTGPGIHPAQGQGGGAGEHVAHNLGVDYQPVHYHDGTFGARLTRPPLAGSPAAAFGLEPGDIILELDGQRFRDPADLLAHRGETTIQLINVRNGHVQDGHFILP